jgi:CIC family chloride channel protein
MIPVALATVAASYVGRLLLGAAPSFVIPAFAEPYFRVTQPSALLAYAGLGVLMGLASLVFIKALYGAEDFFESRIPDYYARHLLGMLAVGVMIWTMKSATGRYYVEGVGNAAIQGVLTGTLASGGFLLLLFALKLLATSLTLGTGASGGIFSPSLFMGAALAAAYGAVLRRLFPSLPVTPAAFAVAGMAGMIGGATGAMVTAVVMVFEMTRDYTVIVPMTVVVAIAYGLRKKLSRDSLYTLKLTRRGRHVPDGLHAAIYDARRARELSAGAPPVLSADARLCDLAEGLDRADAPEHFLVEDGGRLAGLLLREDALAALTDERASSPVRALARPVPAVVPDDGSLFDVVAALRARPGPVALLAPGGTAATPAQVTGLVAKAALADALVQTAEFFVS